VATGIGDTSGWEQRSTEASSIIPFCGWLVICCWGLGVHLFYAAFLFFALH
jgi:hypothetical protein